jgi:hypothetical protein
MLSALRRAYLFVGRLVLFVLRPCLFGIAGLLALGGIFGFYEAGRLADLASNSPSWPTTTGVIEESRVIRMSNGDGVRVVYSYSVDDVRYSSSNISYKRLEGARGEWLLPDTPRGIVSRYPVGKEVSVYYHPRDPRSAVLEPGTSGAGGSLSIGALVLLVLACVLALVARTMGRSPAAARPATVSAGSA